VKRDLAAVALIAVLFFALFEVGAHVLARSRVPKPEDWRAAAGFVRSQLRPRDLIVAAPGWTDPLLREVLGDRIDLPMVGRSDTAAYERLWSLSIRGARPREAPPGPPSLQRSFGRVLVRRWELGDSPVSYDFAEHLPRAQVSASEGGAPRPCPLRRFGPPRGGGLGVGVLPPEQRFGCGSGAHGAWVASVVLEDLALTARHCVYAAPTGPEPLRVAFEDVPLGERLVLYGGLYYEHERMREGGPVSLRVLVDGREAGRMLHRDGDGWKRMELAMARGRGEVAFEVSAPDPRRRSFCWSATIRTGSYGVRAKGPR
jgi:hypothetical protein